MFAGIIQGRGTIFEKRPVGGGMVFGIEADFDLPDPEEGGRGQGDPDVLHRLRGGHPLLQQRCGLE